MLKKISLILAAAAVMAFAVPSIASASEATLPAGTRAPLGTQFWMTGSDIIVQSSLIGRWTCSTLNLTAEIVVNNGTTFDSTGENVSPTQSGCVNGTKTITVTNFRITSLKAVTPGSATLNFSSLIDVGTELKCTFTGTTVAGSYVKGSDTLTFSSASGVAGSPAACGTAKLTASFILEQAGTGTALILD